MRFAICGDFPTRPMTISRCVYLARDYSAFQNLRWTTSICGPASHHRNSLIYSMVDSLTWAKDADATRLVEMIRIHSGVGARLVSRSRGRGKRSRARLEPVIFGQARGDGGGVNTGGRPSQDARDTLVMHLTVDWTIATGTEPLPGRSDHAGFGDLVHTVFQWLHEPSPDQALRRYWNEVEKGRSRSAVSSSF